MGWCCSCRWCPWGCWGCLGLVGRQECLGCRCRAQIGPGHSGHSVLQYSCRSRSINSKQPTTQSEPDCTKQLVGSDFLDLTVQSYWGRPASQHSGYWWHRLPDPGSRIGSVSWSGLAIGCLAAHHFGLWFLFLLEIMIKDFVNWPIVANQWAMFAFGSFDFQCLDYLCETLDLTTPASSSSEFHFSAPMTNCCCYSSSQPASRAALKSSVHAASGSCCPYLSPSSLPASQPNSNSPSSNLYHHF